jgi:hypothetical protein
MSAFLFLCGRPRIIVATLFLTVISSLSGNGHVSAQKASDRSNLRQIGQASLIYAQEHQNQFPHATDVWDYARMLAQDAGLDSANLWQSSTDPAAPWNIDRSAPVLTAIESAKPRQLTPAFRELIPCFAVVLGKLDTDMPATTPIAWTRGLQPDGTWARHSPYGEGGYVFFMNGNIMFFRSIAGELTRFDGTGTTSNILEALPPGTRIGEYVPTVGESTQWRRTNAIRSFLAYIPPALIGLFVLWAPFVWLSISRMVKKQKGALTVLLWPLIITILLAIVVPTVS